MNLGEEMNRKIFEEVIIMTKKKGCKNIINIYGYSYEIKFKRAHCQNLYHNGLIYDLIKKCYGSIRKCLVR